MLLRILSYVALSWTLLIAFPIKALAECVNLSPYNLSAEISYEEIFDFEVKSFPMLVAHPYEIEIPNTSPGQLLACQIIVDNDGGFSKLPTTPGWASLLENGPETRIRNHQVSGRDLQFVKSGHGKTKVFFSHKIQDARFQCFVACVTRKGE